MQEAYPELLRKVERPANVGLSAFCRKVGGGIIPPVSKVDCGPPPAHPHRGGAAAIRAWRAARPASSSVWAPTLHALHGRRTAYWHLGERSLMHHVLWSETGPMCRIGSEVSFSALIRRERSWRDEPRDAATHHRGRSPFVAP
jgi:hypothetical protein